MCCLAESALSALGIGEKGGKERWEGLWSLPFEMGGDSKRERERAGPVLELLGGHLLLQLPGLLLRKAPRKKPPRKSPL